MRNRHFLGTTVAWMALSVAAATAGCSTDALDEEERLAEVEQRADGIEPGWAFIRGDANRDGQVDISDAITVLNTIHDQGGIITCEDAADANDDGLVNQDDANHILDYLFLGGVEIPAPTGAPGTDPTLDDIRCGVVDIDPERSLVVRDVSLLDDTFSLERTMTQLAAQSGEPGLTATALFQRWFAHQTGPDCVSPNEFEYDCGRAEGQLATMDPFADNPLVTFTPVGLYNRFDLAPPDGAHCGEHRIVYAKTAGLTGSLLFIFEAQIPNPHPEDGLEGCRGLIEWWAALSDDRPESERRDMLERLFYTGVHGYQPAVHIDNYAPDTGQVRTNNFVQGPWLFREFKVTNDGALDFIPEPVKGNPFVGYFNPTSDLADMADFQAYFIGQVENLIADPFFLENDDRFNDAESAASSSDDYVSAFVQGTAQDPSFSNMIQERLDELDSDLTPTEVVDRAHVQSCAGCHTDGTGFRHQFDFQSGGQWIISNPLQNDFLPARESQLEPYLDE